MNTADQLQALELELLTNTTRKDTERMSSLLADNFREFGSSGRIYSKEDTISMLQPESSVSIAAVDVEVRLLSEHIALVTYTSVKKREGKHVGSALRSSIWIRDSDHWSIIFHQGTKLP